MVHVGLANGRVVEMSARHPTITGQPFGALSTGDLLGGVRIVSVAQVPYEGAFTYDILTDGDRGAYVADGVLVGSTLWHADGSPLTTNDSVAGSLTNPIAPSTP
jgi:hypothetical protein